MAQLEHAGKIDQALSIKAGQLAQSAETMQEVVQNVRDTLVGFDMMDPASATQEMVDNAIEIQHTVATHIYGMKDMLKRFRNFLPKF